MHEVWVGIVREALTGDRAVMFDIIVDAVARDRDEAYIELRFAEEGFEYDERQVRQVALLVRRVTSGTEAQVRAARLRLTELGYDSAVRRSLPVTESASAEQGTVKLEGQLVASLAAALAASRPYNHVELSAGIFDLPGAVLAHPIVLSGVGIATKLRLSGAFQLERGGSLHDLAVLASNEGNGSLSLIRCSGGSADIRHVQVSGGRCGIEVVGLAHVTMTYVTSWQNHIGLLVDDEGLVRADHCSFKDNQADGVVLQERASATFDGIHAVRNGANGIVVRNAAYLHAIDTRCNLNNASGLAVSTSDRVHCESCWFEQNEQDGIQFVSKDDALATQEIRNSQVQGNGGFGVLVAESSAPTLFGLVVRQNGKDGINYAHRAAGRCQGCTACDNGKSGILVGDSSAPVLASNKCIGNYYAGIAFFGKAVTSVVHAVANTCNGNRTGITVNLASRVWLESNDCSNNRTYGIALWEGSVAEAVQNKLSGNAKGDVIATFDQSALTQSQSPRQSTLL